ncbi:MAG: DNA methyltransferase [Minisyncoccia bacterium]|jgi:site-specific DNA-methyltransferase (adenine-specific)
MNKQPESKQKNLIKPGTIWQLDEHRLAYGDARDKKLLERLIGDTHVNLLCCDVPYGVAVAESKRGFKTLSKDKAVANDHLQSDAEYRKFTREWLEAVTPFLARRNAAYIFNADKMVWALREGMLEADFKVAQLLVWVKSQAVVGRLDYAPAHELILYGWHGVHKFRRSKDKSVLFYPRPTKSKMHPTTKPIGLIRRLILNSTDIGDTVYDGFLGSGTTLLAAEQTKRRCFGVELDLEYVLIAVERWEKLTGKQAKIIYEAK